MDVFICFKSGDHGNNNEVSVLLCSVIAVLEGFREELALHVFIDGLLTATCMLNAGEERKK